MTIGSPVASAVSGPGTLETNAICLPSGDHATVAPVVGSGLLVPVISARNFAPVPSGRAIARPLLSPTRPRYAIHCPSGDHTGLAEPSFSPPNRTVLPSATVITQIWPQGRPAPSLFSTLYATRVPSGDTRTPATERNFNKSPDCTRSWAATDTVQPITTVSSTPHFVITKPPRRGYSMHPILFEGLHHAQGRTARAVIGARLHNDRRPRQ